MKIELTDEEINWLYEAMDCNFATLPNSNDRYYDSIPEVIKQKLVATFKLDYEIMAARRKYKYCEEPHFTDKELFLGRGIHSVNEANMAHKRLAYAIMLLGGLQQPGHPETKEQADQEAADCFKFECQIKYALKDIIAAFGYTPEELNVVSK